MAKKCKLTVGGNSYNPLKREKREPRKKTLSLKKEEAKELLIRIRSKVNGIKHGYMINPELDELEKLLK